MKQTNHMSHMVWWMLGCIILALIILSFGRRTLGGVALFLLPLICVLSHIFMMKSHGSHSMHEENKKDSIR